LIYYIHVFRIVVRCMIDFGPTTLCLNFYFVRAFKSIFGKFGSLKVVSELKVVALDSMNHAIAQYEKKLNNVNFGKTFLDDKRYMIDVSIGSRRV
jgi:cytochrome c peroxidase